jgi:hypothetical protein
MEPVVEELKDQASILRQLRNSGRSFAIWRSGSYQLRNDHDSLKYASLEGGFAKVEDTGL